MSRSIAGRDSVRPWNRLSDLIRRAPLVSFFVLAFGLTWAWWVPLAVSGRVVDAGSWRPTHVPGEFGPLLAAAIVIAATRGRPGLRDLLARMTRWRVAWQWWLVAVSPLVFFAVAAPLSRLFSGDWPIWSDFDQFSGIPGIGVVGLWAVLIASAFGEEVGWRGYATPTLQQTRTPLRASLVLAMFWMAWHTPAFFVIHTYRDLSVTSYPGFFLGLVCGAVVLTWLSNRSGQSILLVAIWHGTYNLVSGASAVEGAIAAIVSGLVMALAGMLIVMEIRATRRGLPSVLGSPNQAAETPH